MLSLKTLKTAFKNPHTLVYFAVFSMAFVLILPQLTSRTPNLGIDAIFHFNRFYESASQLAHGHLDQFQSLYGFQQSGRIVNALYGPLFAYVLGGVLLLLDNWVTFELVTSFLLSVIAGCGMVRLSRAIHLTPGGQSLAALLYMALPLTNQWYLNQSFSAWGAAFMPYLFVYAVALFKSKQKYPWWQLGLTLALVTQVHLLSALIGTLILLLMFISACWHDRTTFKRLFCPLTKAALLFALLSANILVSLAEVYRSNTLIQPYIPKDLTVKSMQFIGGTANLRHYGDVWLLAIILAGMTVILAWRQLTPALKSLVVISLLFGIASSDILPWNQLRELAPSVVNLLQFPSRLAVASNVGLALFIGLGFSLLLQHEKWSRIVQIIIIALMVWMPINEIHRLSQNSLARFITSDVVETSKHTYADPNLTKPELIAAWQQATPATGVAALVKATPDYLPDHGIQRPADNPYVIYTQEILHNPLKPTITVTEQGLRYTWHAKTTDEVIVPTIVYAHSVVTVNGKVLEQPTLTKIGALKFQPTVGENHVEVYYQPASGVHPLLVVNACLWALLPGIWYWRRQQ